MNHFLFSYFFPGKPSKNAKCFSSNSPKANMLKKKKVNPIKNTGLYKKKKENTGKA